MNKKDEALKLALEALKKCHYYMIDAGLPNQSLLNEAFTAYKALDEALAQQPAQEPMAWMHIMNNTEGLKANKPVVVFTKSKRNPFGVAGRDYSKSYPVTKQPLYTRPQAREPKNEEFIAHAWANSSPNIGFNEFRALFRSIEAAHGITGEKK